jgi:hypothetical protein
MTSKIIIGICVIVIGCGLTKPNRSNECSNEQRLAKLIQTVAETPEIQEYFHNQDDIPNHKLVILENNENLRRINSKELGTSIMLLTKSEITKKNIGRFIEFKTIDISKPIAIVKMVYAVEGIEYNAKYKLENCEWILIEKQLFEK